MGDSRKLASLVRISPGRRTEVQQEIPLQSLLQHPNTQKTHPTSNSKCLLHYRDLQNQTCCKYSEMACTRAQGGFLRQGHTRAAERLARRWQLSEETLTRSGCCQSNGGRFKCGVTGTCSQSLDGRRAQSQGLV